MTAPANEYMSNSAGFLANQNENFKKDLAERQQKIDIVSHLVAMGADVRVNNFKAQALESPDLLETAISSLDKVPEMLNDLREITREKEDIQKINSTQTAALKYQNAHEAVSGAISERGPWLIRGS